MSFAPEWIRTGDGVYERRVVNGFGEFVFTAVFREMAVHVNGTMAPHKYELRVKNGHLRIASLENVGHWSAAMAELTAEYLSWLNRSIVS